MPHPRVQKGFWCEEHGGLMQKAAGVLFILFPVRERMEWAVLLPSQVRKETGRTEMELKNHGYRAEVWQPLGCIGQRDSSCC